MSNRRILVLGAGAWGTALALVLCRNPDNEVFLWGRDRDAMAAAAASRRNERYLPGIELPPALNLLSGDELPRNIGIVVAAVPFQTLRKVLQWLIERSDPPNCIACACKGLEHETFARADQIVADVYQDKTVFAMLSGPNFAIEVAEQRPAAITIASRDKVCGQALIEAFHSALFRPYLSDDIVGVQIGGAIKNVMAIAAGIADGLALGANSRAALITRGLAEITRFGVAAGGRQETFMGLSGLGDLILTCTDDKSRNRRYGLSLASGANSEAAIASTGLVEGASTAIALANYAERSHIEMPITQEVAATISGSTSPLEAVSRLLARDPVTETDGA